MLDYGLARRNGRLLLRSPQPPRGACGDPGVQPAATPSEPQHQPVYPAGRNSYVSGTIVKASDSQFYKCNPGVAAWCNSAAEWAYAPATGAATTSAWTLQSCK